MTALKTRYGGVAGPRPNWNRPVELKFEFRTGVNVSRDGTEQRWAMRQTARVSLAYGAMFTQPEVMRLQADVESGQGGTIFTVPGAFRSVALAVDADATDTTIEIDEAAFWIGEGGSLVIEDATTVEAVQVQSIAGTTVTLEDPLNASFLAGTRVVAGFRSRMQDKISLTANTDSVWDGFFTWDVDPGSDPQLTPAASPTLFEDVEVFLTKPNYREAPKIEFEAMQEIMDVGHGLISVSSPWSFNPRTEQLLFSALNRTRAEDLIGFFIRQKGKRGSFWMPTWTHDIAPAQAETSGSFDITVAGSDFDEAFSGSSTYNVVAAMWADGTVELNRVASMTVSSGDTVVTFESAWSQAITTSTVFCWCPRVRFVADDLDVRWFTSTVAEMQFNVRQIPNEGAQV